MSIMFVIRWIIHDECFFSVALASVRILTTIANATDNQQQQQQKRNGAN